MSIKTMVSACRSAKLLLPFLALVLPLIAFSQNKSADKANELYKMEQYAQAASLYEEAITELQAKGKSSRSLLNLQTKLAFCYRVNNRMDEAEALYGEVVKNERAKAKTYFFFGETLMANEKYEEAKHWFTEYQKIEPDDEKAKLMIQACGEVQFIEPYFQFVDVQEFAHNSEADDNAAVAWQEGVVFSSDRKMGVKLMKEKSGWTGRDYLDVYFSKKKENGSYSEPKQFSGKLSELNKNTGNTSFSLDGLEVFFTRNDNVLNKQKTYNLQLFRAENEDGRWRNDEKLSFCSANHNFMHPAISPDGKMLFFTTNKPGGQGGTDIWVSIREDGKWSKPENLGPNINTLANEGFPFMDELGRLYFCSKGHVGYGGFDIFFTEMTGNGVWKKPMNLGKPINSSLDDISVYVDGVRKSGMFSSSRNGGDDDIFLFEVLDAAPPEIEEEIMVNEEIPVQTLEEEVAFVEVAEEVEVVKIENLPIENEQVEIIEAVEIVELEPAAQQPKEEEIVIAETSEPEVISLENTSITTSEVVEMTEPESVDNLPIEKPAAIEIEEALTVKDQEVEIEEVIEMTEVEPAFVLPEIDSTERLSVVEPEPEELPQVEGKVHSTPSSTFEAVENISPIEAIAKMEKATEIPISTTEVPLHSFQNFVEKAARGELKPGERFRLDNAVFDPQIWQLTPKVSKSLNEVSAVLRRFPTLKIELSAHTESMGVDESNLRLSQSRADTAVEYISKNGIDLNRLEAKGYGETMPLNHCKDGARCSLEEYLFNQRLEVKILDDGKSQ